MPRLGGLALVLSLQAALVSRLVSPADVLSRPFATVNFPLHYLEATRHGYAHFGTSTLFGVPLPWFTSEERLRAALDRYAVAWVIVVAKQTRERSRGFPGVLEPAATIGDAVVFRVRDAERSRVMIGTGEARAELDRIEVRDAAGERVVLGYHWLPTLRTIPPLAIEEHPLPGAPVGFIAVRPQGRRDFVVVNGGAP